MSFDLGSLLQQFTGGGASAEQADRHFDQVAQSVPQGQLAQGLGQAFRSDQTPPFAQMAAQLFGNSDPNQRAGMLNQILGSIGPGVLSSLAGGALGGSLGNLFGGGAGATPQQAPQITPEQASQMTPEQVRQIAEQAERHDPSVVDRMDDFYAQHPGLVKGLGGAVLAVALGHMAQGMQRD
ncbi:hypothetical protein [Massilia forsythiae]|uniref:hypothetical protein n=1 Tax=Massilia forsythiae TaxID=2728020 RepID=UPI001E33A312|nr:hypothetical protein [Massilia forsythiae]